MVPCSIGTAGKSGNPSTRRVDRTRRSPSGGTLRRAGTGIRVLVVAGSSAARSLGSAAGGSGSSVRCHPSRHCCIRSHRARFAQDGQRDSRVDPHGNATVTLWPVSRSRT